MSVEQESVSIEDTDREPVCAGCEHPPDEDEDFYPVVLDPRLESDDTPDLVVDQTQETIEFDPEDLQSFLDQYTNREVDVVADHVFPMHGGCIASLFDVDVEPAEDGLDVSERGASSAESAEDDSQQYTGISKVEVVCSWFGLVAAIAIGYLLAEGLLPAGPGVLAMIAALSILVQVWPSESSRGGL